MASNLFRAGWADRDVAELRFVLSDRIGEPGQYEDRANRPNEFYLPLAGLSCRIKLTFSDTGQIVAIEAGPAFDAAQWDEVVQEIERTAPRKVGRDCSFSGYRVTGSWRGKRSDVQILPPPPGAPLAPVELAEHPFVLEFPVVVSDRWSMTNFRRRREHRKLSLLLNVLLAGGVSRQPIQSRHPWAIEAAKGSGADAAKWVQEFYFADIGEVMREDLSPPVSGTLEEVEPDAYYRSVGHDGRGLRVPADLDDSICRYNEISESKVNREKFEIAAYWMEVASRQWTLSFSASFASLVIAIEALGERTSKPEVRFKDFIERYAPGASLESRRKAMYAQRNHILHGSGLMAFDQEAHYGWAPPEESGRELMEELWGLTRIAVRNWIKFVPPS